MYKQNKTLSKMKVIELNQKEVSTLDALTLEKELTNVISTTKEVAINLSNVKVMSIASIGVLVWAVRSFKSVSLIGANDAIMHKLNVIGIIKLIQII